MPNNTHYDNLKVPRDASSETIRRAYKELIQQYTADQNPSADASRIMKVIHNSYSILSNPIQKSKYDQWLLEQLPPVGDAKAGAESVQTGSNRRSNSRATKPVEVIAGTQADNKIDEILGLTLVAGNEIANIPDKKAGKRIGWPVYGAIGLLAISAVAWLGFSNGTSENESQQEPMANDAVASAPAMANVDSLPAPTTDNGPILPSAGIPAHDTVEIGAFIGAWKGIDDADDVTQNLDISLKSETSFAFRLDTKAGQSIGGLYGVAEFESGYARFHNREYGCNIVFSIKSQVLQVGATDCQAFYRNGAVFSGNYMRPNQIKPGPKPAAPVTKPAAAPVVESTAGNPQPEVQPPAPAKPVTRLRKYMATVRNADGSETTIELLAKDKNAARAIIRDFRGNPKVIKIKEMK